MNKLGRPLEFNPQKAVDAAIEQFWQQGYEATSLTDLLDTMNLSRSSLYQTFGSKQQLFERCLAQYGDWLAASMAKDLEEAASGKSFIANFFMDIANTAEEPEGTKSCLMVNSANEFGQSNAAVAAVMSEKLQRIASVFVEAIQRAQREGDVSPQSDPAALTNYLMMSLAGLRTMVKTGADKNSTKGIVTLILQSVV
jgi:TetR/AcrR family transcriptional repressor of nem operon